MDNSKRKVVGAPSSRRRGRHGRNNKRYFVQTKVEQRAEQQVESLVQADEMDVNQEDILLSESRVSSALEETARRKVIQKAVTWLGGVESPLLDLKFYAQATYEVPMENGLRVRRVSREPTTDERLEHFQSI